MTGDIGPDAVIDAVGMEAHGFAFHNVLDAVKPKVGEWSKLDLAQSLALPAFAVQNQVVPRWYFYFVAPTMKAGVPDPADRA